ncbi:MAG: nucleotidyltransferase domain-containing protein [Candidatus Taylorbacteria bacterium]|nr:nucleotidyltransferase domain-containing protein [Candidatus Taylorbacteria bacterium]
MITIQGLEDYCLKDIQTVVLSHIDNLRGSFHFEDLDFSIKAIVPFGSRVTGFSSKKSDLDVKIEYTGNAREDDLLNALNDNKMSLKIENIRVDFYPKKIFTK